MAYTKISAIYQILCTGNGKRYIGSAVSLYQRWACHRSMLNRNVHNNKHLQNAWAKYGERTFQFSVVEPCPISLLIQREQYWIDTLGACSPEVGMNNSPTASTSLGFRHSEETKKKLSDIAKKRDNSHLLENAARMRGKPSPSKGFSGKKWTPEMKLAASINRKGRVPWNRGIPMRDDVRKKVSETLLLSDRKTISQEVRDKINALRSAGFTYPSISKITGVSIAHSYRIAPQPKFGMRSIEKIKGATAASNH